MSPTRSILVTLLALLSAALLAGRSSGAPPQDPRVAINAVNTPGDATATFVIDQSGSYYLEQNLLGEAGKHGIRVDAPSVHIDLLGLELRGVAGSLDALHINDVQTYDVTVERGFIKRWDGFGVHYTSAGPPAAPKRVTLLALNIAECESGGILGLAPLRVQGCTVQFVSGVGVRVGDFSFLESCLVRETDGGGIRTGFRSQVRDCTVSNAGGGAIALQMGVNSTASNCTLTGSTVGLSAGPQSLVTGCTISSTFQAGIELVSGTVRDCLVAGNEGHGIVAERDAHLIGNTVTANQGDGIRALASARIEQNDVRGHVGGHGIRVFGTGSFVARNTLFSNATPLSVPNAGNFTGPLVHVNAVNGRSEPWANLFGL